jgi:4a-hydroxytetrahydrobiopterin dehydratase
VIHKRFTFGNFKEAMAFVNQVAELAESADHHPDILVNYKRVTLTLSTHSAGGLTQKDFDLASHIEKIPRSN